MIDREYKIWEFRQSNRYLQAWKILLRTSTLYSMALKNKAEKISSKNSNYDLMTQK